MSNYDRSLSESDLHWSQFHFMLGLSLTLCLVSFSPSVCNIHLGSFCRDETHILMLPEHCLELLHGIRHLKSKLHWSTESRVQSTDRPSKASVYSTKAQIFSKHGYWIKSWHSAHWSFVSLSQMFPPQCSCHRARRHVMIFTVVYWSPSYIRPGHFSGCCWKSD